MYLIYIIYVPLLRNAVKSNSLLFMIDHINVEKRDYQSEIDRYRYLTSAIFLSHILGYAKLPRR